VYDLMGRVFCKTLADYVEKETGGDKASWKLQLDIRIRIRILFTISQSQKKFPRYTQNPTFQYNFPQNQIPLRLDDARKSFCMPQTKSVFQQKYCRATKTFPKLSYITWHYGAKLKGSIY
jgi:hypothetical protein